MLWLLKNGVPICTLILYDVIDLYATPAVHAINGQLSFVLASGIILDLKSTFYSIGIPGIHRPTWIFMTCSQIDGPIYVLDCRWYTVSPPLCCILIFHRLSIYVPYS